VVGPLARREERNFSSEHDENGDAVDIDESESGRELNKRLEGVGASLQKSSGLD